MASSFWRKRASSAAYVPLTTSPTKSENSTISLPYVAWHLLILILVSGLSFKAGQRLAQPRNPIDILQLHSAARSFQYESIFAERPNITTDRAWLGSFPTQGGFFKHPQLAPDRSTFAVFHQLHCLDGLRHAYWTLLDISQSGAKLDKSALPHHATPSHVRHCIDLLRQALMCQPDLTIEVQNDELGGVTGFGTEHVCADWKQLIEWTSHWENYDQTPPPDTEPELPSRHSSHAHPNHHSIPVQ